MSTSSLDETLLRPLCLQGITDDTKNDPVAPVTSPLHRLRNITNIAKIAQALTDCPWWGRAYRRIAALGPSMK